MRTTIGPAAGLAPTCASILLAVGLGAVPAAAGPPDAVASRPAARVAEPQAPVVASVNTRERTVTKLAEGVYTIRHEDAPDGFPQSNTTVVVGDRGVFVVDSCYLPSSARKDVEQIRAWTNKPVLYLLNTHWHYDHTMGNRAYADAFPSVTIVAQRETRRQIAGYNPGWFRRYPEVTAGLRRNLETNKEDDGTPLTDARRKEIADSIPGREAVQAEFANNHDDPAPTLAFDRELDVDLGGREVDVRFLGRGNTAGDAVVYLPKEKILVTGDLLDHPVPYLGGGYPSELAATLDRLAEFDAATIVPGHGAVMHDKAYMRDVAEFVRTVAALVSEEVHRTGSGPRHLEEVRAAVARRLDVDGWRRRFAGDDKDNRDFFDQFSYPGIVTAAYAEVWGR